MKTLFKWIIPIVLSAICFYGCVEIQSDNPIYLEGDYYGEVISSWSSFSFHEHNVRVKVVIDDHTDRAIITFIMEEGGTFSEVFDFDRETMRGETSGANDGTGLMWEGWVRIDGVICEGTYRRYDLDQNNKLLWELIWECKR